MNSPSSSFNQYSPSMVAPGETINDYRSRVALEQLQAAERRRLELAEQLSPVNSPDTRIRAWERAHGLRLPTDTAHPVLSVIAALTHLTLEDVHEEQRRRSLRPQPAMAAQPGY